MNNKSIFRQFLIYISSMAVFLLIGSIVILLIQNSTLSKYAHQQKLLEQKYSLTESLEDNLNQSLLNFWISNQQLTTTQLSPMKEDIDHAEQIGLTEKDRLFLNKVNQFLLYYEAQLTLDHAIPKPSNPDNKIKYDDIRNEFRAYKLDLNQIRSQASNEFDTNKTRVQIAFICYLALSLLSIMLVIKILVRRLGVPLRELAHAADQLSAGEKDIEIRDLKRADEIGILSRAFHNMVSHVQMAERSVNHLNAELAEKNEELEQIVYVASHDLRSPLINIQGFSKELNESFKQIQDIIENEVDLAVIKKRLLLLFQEDIPEAFNFILASTDKMDLLLTGLLRLSRLGRGQLRIIPLKMNEIISNVAKSFKYQQKELQMSFAIHELPDCFGDRLMVDQILSNLIANALKFRSPERKAIITITGFIENGRAVYCIEDNGIGIPLAYQKKIFNLFEKIDVKKDGEGLGLTIVRKLLDRHNGEIWVESVSGEGSRFYFALPKIY